MRRIAFTIGVARVGAVLVLGAAGCGGVVQTALGDLEDCVNGVDDNGDGLADCEDPQCVGHAACLGMREMTCANGADDDGDGLVDCEDPDCLQTTECDPSREWSCHDGVDNDNDGLPDCLDPDCEQACTEVCNDGVDNDGDGKVDCDDPDCAGVDGCQGNSELCGNGHDDDGDELVDCDDPDCDDHPLCTQVEICNNEIDDDGDGLINCDDPDCAASPYCMEVNCLDGEDNDGDGHIDCDDPDCAGALACLGGTACLPAQPLPCGQPVESTTEGRLNNFMSYPCRNGTFGGPERYFQFTAQRDLWLDLYLYDWNYSGLTMIATSGDPSGGCDLGNVCESESDPGINFLPLIIEEGATLFLIVDGPANMPGVFELWMDCTPVDEVGLCGDGLDNDFDGWADCWDDDCVGDPGCDYWVSAGIYCINEYNCAPGEYCENVIFNGSMYEVSFCTRSCSSVGATGGECATQSYGDGLCTGYHSTQGPRCVLPCASPTDPCPPGSVCTDIVSGSITDLNNGYCLPYQ
jgi:hypothetical protein